MIGEKAGENELYNMFRQSDKGLQLIEAEFIYEIYWKNINLNLPFTSNKYVEIKPFNWD